MCVPRRRSRGALTGRSSKTRPPRPGLTGGDRGAPGIDRPSPGRRFRDTRDTDPRDTDTTGDNVADNGTADNDTAGTDTTDSGMGDSDMAGTSSPRMRP